MMAGRLAALSASIEPGPITPVSMTPLGEDEFAALLGALGPFERPPFLAVAVSGGADSLALGILARGWAAARGGVAHALTVDHGLRPESAGEAAQVGRWLAARGMPHTILRWQGEKPSTRLQERARFERYRLLAAWCRERGCLHLLTGHHRADQIETHLIRAGAGSGRRGLAGMASLRELADCRLLRPLLSVPPARLAAVLKAERQPFLTDPSNSDPRYDRARLRRDAGFGDAPTLAAEIAALGGERRQDERAGQALLARTVLLHPAGFAVLEPGGLTGADVVAVGLVLSRLVQTIGGGLYPPRGTALAALRQRLAAGRAVTLGGCRFVPWRERILVLREAAATAPPLALAPGESGCWDRRFTINHPAAAPAGISVGGLGTAAIPALRRVLPAPPDLPPLVWPVLPAIRREGRLVAVPALGFAAVAAADLPLLRFRPANPLSSAAFTVV